MRNNCGNCIRQGRSRLKHLESYVVSVRDCLHSVYESISHTWINTH